MESEENNLENSDICILMVGLDDAGKTTLLYKLKQSGEDDLETIPTIGYNVESIEFEDKLFKFWDIGGRDTVRVLWNFYAKNKAAVVFVVDASNSDRFDEGREFLHTIMAHKDLNNVRLLIVSNKHDKSNCSTTEQLKEKLNLKNIMQATRIVNTSAFDRQSLNNIMCHLKDLNLFC